MSRVCKRRQQRQMTQPVSKTLQQCPQAMHLAAKGVVLYLPWLVILTDRRTDSVCLPKRDRRGWKPSQQKVKPKPCRLEKTLLGCLLLHQITSMTAGNHEATCDPMCIFLCEAVCALSALFFYNSPAKFGDSNSNHPGCSTPKSSRRAPGPDTVIFGLPVERLFKLEKEEAFSINAHRSNNIQY